MLERFHVPKDKAIFIKPKEILKTVTSIFSKTGLPDQDSLQAAEVLIYADSRGIDSHGVSNMLRNYVASFNKGHLNNNPKWKIKKEFGAVCTIDGDGGLGSVVGPHGMREAIKRAKEFGIGSVTVMNSGHFGAAAYYADQAVKSNMIGLATTGGGVGMAPTFSSEKLLGLNPIAVGAPTKVNPPFIFDASTSSVAGNKIELARRLGVKVLPGWISDKDGVPIMEEVNIPEYDNPKDKPMVLPFGGTRELGSHKGYSFSVIAEILCGGLGNNGLGPFRRDMTAHHFTAYNIEAFGSLEEFTKDLDEYLTRLKESKPAPGHERVVYAGLPEHEEETHRIEEGIPYHPEVVDWFRDICQELAIEFTY